MSATFTHEIREEWQQDVHDADVTSLYVGRFAAVVTDQADQFEWELYLRDTRLTFGYAYSIETARAKAEQELRDYIQ